MAANIHEANLRAVCITAHNIYPQVVPESQTPINVSLIRQLLELAARFLNLYHN